MKPTIFLLTLLIGCQVTKAQDDLETTFNAYLKAKESKNVAKQLEFLHPKLFDVYPKDSFVKDLKILQSQKNVMSGEAKLISVSEILTEKNIQYAVVTFTETMIMDMSDVKGKGGADYAMSLALIELRKEHGEDKVFFDEELYQIKVETSDSMYAILDPAYGDWKFLFKNHDMIEMLNAIVPETVRNKF